VSKRRLMDAAWPGMAVEEGNLSVLISTVRKQIGDGSDAIIVTVPRIGYRLVTQPGLVTRDQSGPPLIAVLPFANHGSSAEDGYFADGVVDDVITALSRFKTFAAVSRGSSFALREKGANARAAAAEFGARYVLEGSIRRRGDQLRVTSQLSDASSGAQLWAEKFDGAVADIFSFEDRITQGVVGRIEPTIRQAEIERARRKPAANLNAYELFLKAIPLVNDPGIDRHPEALSLLEKAMELDPSFALPAAYAAEIYEKRISLRAPPVGNNDAAIAIGLARTALGLAQGDPLVRAICAWVLFRVDGDLSAIEAARRAVEDNPNHVTVLQRAAAVVGMHGAADEAFRYHARAYELSPGGPEAYDSLFGMASAELVMGNNEAAIHWALKSLATFNYLLFTYITLTAAYANLNRMDEAQAMLRKVREDSPHLTIKLIEDGVAREDSFAWAVIPGLRKAGLPER
jgi:TolB-like protein